MKSLRPNILIGFGTAILLVVGYTAYDLTKQQMLTVNLCDREYEVQQVRLDGFALFPQLTAIINEKTVDCEFFSPNENTIIGVAVENHSYSESELGPKELLGKQIYWVRIVYTLKQDDSWRNLGEGFFVNKETHEIYTINAMDFSAREIIGRLK